jgi:hypothetical protein
LKKITSILLVILFIFTATKSNAQLKIPGTTSAFASDMEKVVKDFPNNFKNIIGELILENPQSADYSSKIIPAGALDCNITRYSSAKKIVTSWQALMFVSDDFGPAEKKFRSMYNQLNGLSVKFENGTSYKFNGDYEKPTENKRFFNVVLSPSTNDVTLKHLKLELIMAYEMMEWKINVLVYESERDDNERGRVIEY